MANVKRHDLPFKAIFWKRKRLLSRARIRANGWLCRWHMQESWLKNQKPFDQKNWLEIVMNP